MKNILFFFTAISSNLKKELQFIEDLKPMGINPLVLFNSNFSKKLETNLRFYQLNPNVDDSDTVYEISIERYLLNYDFRSILYLLKNLGMTKEESLQYIKNIISFFENLFKKEKVDEIFLFEPKSIHYSHDLQILEYIALEKKIKFNFIHSSIFLDNIQIFENLKRVNQKVNKNYLNYIKSGIKNEDVKRVERKVLNYLKLKNSKNFNDYLYGKNIFKKKHSFKEYTISLIHHLIKTKFQTYKYKSDKINFDKKYILYYPNKRNNTRNILFCPDFHSSKDNIMRLSKSIPKDYVLVVKGHPHSHKSKDYDLIKTCKDLKNCLYYEGHTQIESLVKNADIVIGTTSHAVFEALLYYKKILLLGTNNFLIGNFDAPISRFSKDENLTKKISTVIKSKDNKLKIVKFIKAVFDEKNNQFKMQEAVKNIMKKRSPYDLNIYFELIIKHINHNSHLVKDD